LRYQFERLGYFCLGVPNNPSAASGSGQPIFNPTITLRDTWTKEVQKKT
jgi:hypothetical protein